MRLALLMLRTLPLPLLAFAAALNLAQPDIAQAQAAKQTAKPYEPNVGQEGKDVVWVPTPQSLVDKMLDMANVTAKDVVFDLGSGDGRTVITAAKRGARATGIEYNPNMVQLAQRNAAKEKFSGTATFRRADIFKTDFRRADVVTLFLLPTLNVRLRPTILDMKPGTRIVSNTFTMGDWQADDQATVKDCDNYCTALFWIVPAKVQGTWRLPNGELVLEQKYQMLTGTLTTGGASAEIANAKMTGSFITFTVGDAQYTGHVHGSTIEGLAKNGNSQTTWSAIRVAGRSTAKKK